MGFKRNWVIIGIMLCVFPWIHVQASRKYNKDPLNSFIYDYAFNKILPRARTGKLYNVPLPSNMSGIEVSVIRLRTRSLWMNGANFSSFVIPKRTLPWPFTKRVDIVYQNLGNRSLSYYNISHYTIVTPVLGLLAYDSDTNNGLVELNVMGNYPFIVWFPNISFHGDGKVKCCRFDTNGTLEFSNVKEKSSCVANSEGHFSIVVPKIKKMSIRKNWWIFGIALGVVGLMLLLVVGIVLCKIIKRRKLRKMEREAERSERLESTWVGRSRMPSASGIRTQPVLENSYEP